MTRTARLLACLGLGVATTVAVAWASGAWARIHDWDEVQRGRTAEDGSGWFVVRYRQLGADVAVGLPLDGLSSGGAGLTAWPEPGPGRWDRPGAGAPRVRAVCRRGWPLVALECEITGSASGAVLTNGYLLASGRALSSNGIVEALPCMPVWPGFAVDALLYGILWWLAHGLSRWLRRRAERVSWRAVAVACAGCLGLGAISTVLVALVCTMLVSEGGGIRVPRVSVTSSEDGGSWRATRLESNGAMRLSAVRGALHFLPPGMAQPPPLPATWADRVRPGDGEVSRMVDARGWPMLSMWGSFALTQSGSLANTRWAIVRRWSGQPFPHTSTSRIIPLAPIWTGFVVDTLFFGAAWGVLLAVVVGPGAWRHGLRCRRGRCVQCGYDLRGAPGGECPECGTATERTRRSPSTAAGAC